MPRLLANEYVYSTASTDERYNEYINPTSPPLRQYHSQLHQQQTATAAQPGVASQNRSSKSSSHSPPCQQMKTFTTAAASDEGVSSSPKLQMEPQSQSQHHNVDTFSSVDDNDEVDGEEPHTMEEVVTSIRSDDEEGDFEGFDDNCTPDSSGLMQQDQNLEHDGIELQQRCVLKRHSQVDYHDYREDSEGVVEAIEVDDDEDTEEVDGQILLRTKLETTPVKLLDPNTECNPHTPNKRKKHQSDAVCDAAVSPTHLKTQHDQIVEINSDSTTISQKQKRHQINTKFQLNFNQRQNHRAANNAAANKCSTESTSEFPVSSPSNPQQPRGGGKYPPRPPLLKNTLPADSFERQLAMITACNPQMTLTEKIQSWCCEDDLSDVEDVNVFDREFKRLEEQRKRDIKKLKNKRGGGTVSQYDFSVFREMIINNMNNQQHQRFLSGLGTVGSCSAGSGLKGINSTGSDSSKSAKHNDERPSTSAVAQQQLQLRRSKLPNINMEASEIKKRFIKDLPKRNQNSTTPPATSSSENDRDCFQNSKLSGPNKRFPHGSQHLHIHEKMICPSSSEEANSQDVPTHMQVKSNQRMAPIGGERNARQKSPLKPPQDKTSSKNLRCLPGEEIDSVFRLHRLNREIDKPIKERTDLKQPPKTQVDRSDCDHNAAQEKLSQTCLNFSEEVKKSDQIDYIKKQDIFKTPIVPPKYLATLSVSADSPPLQYCCSTTNVNASNEQIDTIVNAALESSGIINSNATTNSDITTTKVKLENVGTDTDFDGVYHQQHEFCNYLGLTGMSTATAMANAVAELAQCNLTRRSMRVLRLQQQERKEKSAKEDRDLKSLKTKQLKEVRKRERGGYEVPVESEESLLFYEEGTNSQISEPTRSTPSLKGFKKKNINQLVSTQSPTRKSLPPVTLNKTEPQIKILCHIAPTKKEDVENIPKECIKEITLPIRETLMRHSKRKNNLKNLNVSKIIDIKEEITSETKTDSVHDDELKLEDILLPDSNVDENKITLRSPRLKAMRGKQKNTKTKTVILEDITQKLVKDEESLSERRVKTSRQEEVTSPLVNIEIVDSDFGNALIMQAQLKSSPLPYKDNTNKETNMEEEIHTSDADEHLEDCDRTLTPTAAPIQEKLQAALEESRKTKPSIFIVQSFECKKEKTTKPVSILQPMQMEKVEMKPVPKTEAHPVTTSPSKKQVKKKTSDEQSDIRSEHTTAIIKKKNSKKKLKAPRKSKKRSHYSLKNGSKRQLRSHKIIFIKSGKSEENLKEELPNEVKKLRSHSKTLSKCNLSKPSLLAEKDAVKSLAPSTSQSNATSNNTKSFRNAQTETIDLEMYNNQAKTRLMAKATALLQRSRRMSVTRGINNSVNLRSKLSAKLRRSTISLRTANTKTPILQPKICLIRANIDEPKKEYKTSSTSTTPPPSEAKVDDLKPMTSSSLKVETTTENQQQPSTTCFLNQENENVVVSSTTNSFDERPHVNPLLMPSTVTLRSVHSSTPGGVVSTPIETKDSWTQIDNNVQGIQYLNSPPSATHIMRNPLKTEHGVVLYIYYEVDILIVVQERLVSFWKCSHLLSALSVIPSTQQQKQFSPHLNMISSPAASSTAQIKSDIFTSDSLYTSSSCIDLQIRVPALSSSLESSHQINGEWILLGELKRLTYDLEVFAPYANRICLHNSTPIYMEMRARHLPKNHRDCNLLSMYINIYYYHDEDIIAKTNSIQLDTIQSDVKTVNYTTLIDSRYFIMTWPQENLLGKTRSGLCKYSLTPQLDTLASIREFKSMRHTIRYLECMSDDKLIGFGDSQLTIWDHRSGDVLMNFDLDMPLGKNLGSVYYSSQEIEQNNMIILFQWRDIKPNEPPELLTIACTITHVQPSYRVLYQLTLPPAFRKIKRAINTGEHLVIIGSESGETEEELWISCGNPALVALIPPLRQDKKRFYNRERSQLIELTEKTLNLDTLANHNLKLAAGLALNTA